MWTIITLTFTVCHSVLTTEGGVIGFKTNVFINTVGLYLEGTTIHKYILQTKTNSAIICILYIVEYVEQAWAEYCKNINL